MSDLTLATRELFVRTLHNHVFRKRPFFDELSKRNKITYKGGKYIEELGIIDTYGSMVQEYETNEALTDEAKNVLEKPRFLFRKLQMPLRYDCDWELQNANAEGEIQLLDLPAFLVKQGQSDLKRRLDEILFNKGSTASVSDTGKYWQNLISALNHDSTYGNLTRTMSSGINSWWQSADAAGLNGSSITSSSQDTEYSLSVSNLRKLIYETDVRHHMEGNDDILVLMCDSLYDKLRAEMESKMQYVPTGDTAKQGFNSMLLDGSIRIESAPYLQTSSTMKTWLFILNMTTWEFRINTARNFKLTEFKWQGEQSNGFDRYLARILLAGNIVCWKPNGNLWLSNVV